MKAFFAKNGVVLVFALALVLIFAFGGMYSRYMTDQVEVHAEEEAKREEEALERAMALELMETMFPLGDDVTRRELTPLEIDYLIPGKSSEYFQPQVEKSFTVYAGTEPIGVIYIVVSHGNKPGLKLAYGIDFATDSILGISVIEHSETDTASYFQKLDETYYAQFSGLSFDTAVLAIDSVAGATYSSRGIEIATIFVREQYASDYDFEIPVVIVNINQVDYNLDPATFADHPFVADVTYGTEAKSIECYLALDFTFSGVKTGVDDLTDDEKLEIKNQAAGSGLSTLSYFGSWDQNTRTLVMHAKGYVTRYTIDVTFVLNAELDAIESYSVLSHESYDSEYNSAEYATPGYSGSGVPYVESMMISQYRDGDTVDSIAGASQKTGPAIRSLLDLFDLFLDSLNGGE